MKAIQNDADTTIEIEPTEDEHAMRESLAQMQSVDLELFGLTRTDNEAGGFRGIDVALTDGGKFVSFLQKIAPADVDNNNLVDIQDPRWLLRNSLSEVVRPLLYNAINDLRDKETSTEDEPLAPDTHTLLVYSPAIVEQLERIDWAKDDDDRFKTNLLKNLKKYADAGISHNFVDLTSTGMLEDNAGINASRRFVDGPVNEDALEEWTEALDLAKDAQVKSPGLASEWPNQIKRHYNEALTFLRENDRNDEATFMATNLESHMPKE